MFKVYMIKECGCVKKDGSLSFDASYEDKKEAELAALRVANHMNKTYCKKHRFHVDESEEGFGIDFDYSCKESGQ